MKQFLYRYFKFKFRQNQIFKQRITILVDLVWLQNINRGYLKLLTNIIIIYTQNDIFKILILILCYCL